MAVIVVYCKVCCYKRSNGSHAGEIRSVRKWHKMSWYQSFGGGSKQNQAFFTQLYLNSFLWHLNCPVRRKWTSTPVRVAQDLSSHHKYSKVGGRKRRQAREANHVWCQEIFAVFHSRLFASIGRSDVRSFVVGVNQIEHSNKTSMQTAKTRAIQLKNATSTDSVTINF